MIFLIKNLETLRKDFLDFYRNGEMCKEIEDNFNFSFNHQKLQSELKQHWFYVNFLLSEYAQKVPADFGTDANNIQALKKFNKEKHLTLSSSSFDDLWITENQKQYFNKRMKMVEK